MLLAPILVVLQAWAFRLDLPRVSKRGSTAALVMAATAAESLEERYAAIAAAQPRQQAAYEAWVASESVDGPALQAKAAALGLTLDIVGGQVAYAPDFEAKRLPLCFDLVYCRHGKTTGNTEPRVYQGYVDEPENALNDIGLAQAQEAADKASVPRLPMSVLTPPDRPLVSHGRSLTP